MPILSGDDTGSNFQPFATVHKPIFSKRDGYIEPWTPEGHDICVDAAKKARSERLELRRRSMDEKLVLAKRGVQCAASAPYGYRFKKLAKRKGAWVIVEEEASNVREMFRLAALGWTGYRIAHYLNGRGIRSAKGGLWSPADGREGAPHLLHRRDGRSSQQWCSES